MTKEAGANPSAAQQRRRLDRQDTFVMELRGLRAEVARVAPLWRPDLDDGAIVNFAPALSSRAAEPWVADKIQEAWEKLASGDHDWAHLAMHLWPERVVPKCIDDRSLAIAHGVEELFWYEDDAGTWQKRKVEASVARKLVRRTSSTVKAALRDLLSAPTPSGGSASKVKRTRATPRKSTRTRKTRRRST